MKYKVFGENLKQGLYALALASTFIGSGVISSCSDAKNSTGATTETPPAAGPKNQNPPALVTKTAEDIFKEGDNLKNFIKLCIELKDLVRQHTNAWPLADYLVINASTANADNTFIDSLGVFADTDDIKNAEIASLTDSLQGFNDGSIIGRFISNVSGLLSSASPIQLQDSANAKSTEANSSAYGIITLAAAAMFI